MPGVLDLLRAHVLPDALVGEFHRPPTPHPEAHLSLVFGSRFAAFPHLPPWVAAASSATPAAVTAATSPARPPEWGQGACGRETPPRDAFAISDLVLAFRPSPKEMLERAAARAALITAIAR